MQVQLKKQAVSLTLMSTPSLTPRQTAVTWTVWLSHPMQISPLANDAPISNPL